MQDFSGYRPGRFCAFSPARRDGYRHGRVYLDSLFGLNLLIDYRLMLASARSMRRGAARWRHLPAAAHRALYAASAWSLPGCGWLGSGAMKLTLGAAMALIAFGGEAHWARCAVVFFAVSAAFGGAVYAASMLAGVSPGSGALVTVSGRVLVLSFAVCYAAVSTVFRRRAKTAAREVRTVTVTLVGRSTTVRALRDSGNDLHDPVSALPAAVVERAAVFAAVPASHALPDDAVQALTVLSALPGMYRTGRAASARGRAVTGASAASISADSVIIDSAPELSLLAPGRRRSHGPTGHFHGAALKAERVSCRRLLEETAHLWTASCGCGCAAVRFGVFYISG